MKRIHKLIQHWTELSNRSSYTSCVALVAALVITHHFVVTALHVLPPNEVSIATIGYVRRYVHPTFTQQWALFAPDPTGSTKHFVVFCRREGETREQAATHVAHPAARYDAIQRRYRLGPGLRMARALTPTAWILPPEDQYTVALRKRAQDARSTDADVKIALAKISKTEEIQDQQRARFLQRVSSYACHASFPHEKIIEVRPSLVVSEAVPFTQRKKARLRPPTRFDLNWFAYVALGDIAQAPRASVAVSSNREDMP